MSKKDKKNNSRQIVKGKIEQAAGKVTGDEDLEAQGAADEVAGDLKQAGEKVKDAFKA
jgi:uncharacterized protein YjbJ (UPF0337 family)